MWRDDRQPRGQALVVRRIDRNQTAFREDARRLFELYRDLRARVETLEREP